MDSESSLPLMTDHVDADAAFALRLQAQEMGIDESEVKSIIDQQQRQNLANIQQQYSYTLENNNNAANNQSPSSLNNQSTLSRAGSRHRRASSTANINPSVQVRRNAIDASMQARPRHNNFLNSLYLCFALAEIVTSTVMLSLYWNKECDSPIATWILVYTLRYVIYLPFDVLSQRYRRRHAVPGIEYEPPIMERKVSSLIKYFVFAWFIVGLYYVISAHQCSNNPLFTLAIVLLSLYGVRLVYPLVVLALFCLCLPCALLLLRSMSTTPQGADQSTINELPSRTYQSTRSLSANGEDECSDDPSCSICLQEYKVGDELRILPHCRPRPHVFHKQCCDTWLATNASCPLCRTSITEEGRAEQERERQEEAQREHQATAVVDDINQQDNDYPTDYQSTRTRDPVDVV